MDPLEEHLEFEQVIENFSHFINNINVFAVFPNENLKPKFRRYRTKDFLPKYKRYRDGIRIYTNGKTPENRGFVSIFYETEIMYISFNCTVSVVDSSGHLCLTQSFGIDFPENRKLAQTKFFESSVGLGEFIKIDFLLGAEKDYLPDDKLRLRFDVHLLRRMESAKWSYRQSDFRRWTELRAFQEKGKRNTKNWFVTGELSDGSIFKGLQLSNLNNSMRIKLGESSEFFKCLFKRSENKFISKSRIMTIDDNEFDVFYDIMSYIYFSTTTFGHIADMNDYYDLYITADKYLLFEFKEMISSLLKNHLENETAAEIFAVADLCYDPQLRKAALEHVILNWDEVQTTEGWAFLRERVPHLEKEVWDLLGKSSELRLLRIKTVEKQAKRYQPHAELFDFYR